MAAHLAFDVKTRKCLQMLPRRPHRGETNSDTVVQHAATPPGEFCFRECSSPARMAGSMSKSSRVQIGLALLVFGLAGIARGQLSGQLGAHDPSTLIKDGGNYYYFATGQGIVSRRSSNLMRWNTGATVFSTAPAWTTSAVPGFTGNFWAPDIAFFNGAYHLYYSVSTFGNQVSAIGMATTPTLDTSSSS